MTDWKKKTLDTYNNSAKELAEYFKGIGSRKKDIDIAFRLASNQVNPDVLEIGCGDGRDAKEIVSKTEHYLGFDISMELINLAKEHVPDAHFIVADAILFDYGSERYDIVFAFASLLHLDKNEIKTVFEKVHNSLKQNGLFYISLKLSDKYEEVIKKDRFGERKFYYYNPKIIKEIAGNSYKIEKQGGGFVAVGNTKWFEIVLRKV